METSRLEFLINRYLDNELALEEKDELQQCLLGDPEARRQFWSETQIHGALRLLEEQESGARAAREDLKVPVERNVIPFRRKLWIGAAAAALIFLIVLGIDRWPSGKEPERNVAGEDLKSPGSLLVEQPASRSKLSDRLFANHKPRFSADRVSAARDRVRQLRSDLNEQPTSRL